MNTPKATVLQFYNAPAKYTVQKEVNLDAANFILDMIYTETLREEEGGTYGASVMGESFQHPDMSIMQVVFDTNPEQADALRALAVKGMKELAENGPSAEFFDRTVKNLEKNLPEKRVTNAYWQNALKTYMEDGIDYDAAYEAAIKALTPEKIREAAGKLVQSGNFAELVMRPAAAE